MDLSKAVWRKASRSTVQNDNCVEITGTPQVVAFRDSKDPDGARLVIGRGEFRRFAAALKNL